MQHLTVLFVFLSFYSYAKDVVSTPVAQGLQLSVFEVAARNGNDKDRISVLRIDPSKYHFKLIAYGRDNKLSAQQEKLPKNILLRKFLKKFQYNGLINASMFRKDHLTSVGYMKDGNYINNPTHDEKYSGILVFNPNGASLKTVDIIEKPKNPNWRELVKDYKTVIENYRTISSRMNVWSPSENRFTYMFQMGLDNKGKILFMGYESSVGRSVYELNELLMDLPTGVENAIYLDGGPHGILQVKAGRTDKEFGARYKAFSPNFLIIQKK